MKRSPSVRMRNAQLAIYASVHGGVPIMEISFIQVKKAATCTIRSQCSGLKASEITPPTTTCSMPERNDIDGEVDSGTDS